MLYALYLDPVASMASPAHVEATYAAVLAAPITTVYADCLHFLASYQACLTGQPSEGAEQPGLLRITETDANGKPLRRQPAGLSGNVPRRGLLARLFPRAANSLIR